MLGAKQAHELPQPHFRQADARTPSRTLSSRSALFGCLVSLIGLLSIVRILPWFSASEQHTHWQPAAAPHQLEAFNASLARCRALDIPSGPPKDFRSRTISDRFVDGTKAVLIRNATVWTGAENGHEVLHETDIWIEGGLIKKIYPTSSNEGSRTTSDNFTTIDAAGRWLTPGIVDVHVHLGVYPMPALNGWADTNSIGNNINPFLRSLDGLNEHDLSFARTLSGGVTSGLMLPGSANSIGGQAFPIKLRPVRSNSPSDRLIDPPASLVLPGEGEHARTYAVETGMSRDDGSTSWRYMKMACGENPRRVYDKTRMDEAWDWRSAFKRASTLRQKQDDWCARASNFAQTHPDQAPSDDGFPEELELEALVDVLRGKVKVNTHCYTATDFDQFIRHSNEFKFPVAAFHHAHEAWLVPELLKKTYGGTPSIAIFSRNANYKLEAYQGTQYAGAILESYNITPLYKSDHPVTDSRRVLSQAAQAHHFGLSAAAALNAVTSKAAEALGLSHRIGYVREGWDADLVLWNTNPLRLGATPVQVLIDGVVQLHKPSTPAPTFGKDAAPAPPPPRSGNYTAEISQMKREGVKSITFDVDPAPLPRKLVHSASFHNVSKVYMRDTGAATGIKVLEIPSSDTSQETSTVLISDGRISCVGTATSCPSSAANSINLNGGVMLPGLTAFQAAASYSGTLGLGDIASEGSASKGQLLKRGVDGGDVHAAAARSSRPDSTVPRAADGLQFGSRDLANAHASGVTSAVVFPVTKATGEQLPAGLSVQFDTGAKSVAESEAIRQAEVALHFSFTHSSKAPSIAEQVGKLREALWAGAEQSSHNSSSVWTRVAHGELPLVVEAHKADHIAQLLLLKSAFEEAHPHNPALALVVSGAQESHRLASELADANVPVLLNAQTRMQDWDDRRALPGPPLSKLTELSALVSAGVLVGIQIEEGWQAANLLWDATWAALDTDGLLKEEDAVALVSTNIEKIFDLGSSSDLSSPKKNAAWSGSGDIVAYDGSPFEYGAKVVAIARKGYEVELF